jgi:cytochrome c oxidase assembly protein subunit 15
MPTMKLTIFRRLCLIGTLLALCVVVLGAWVRLSDAGLGCPDWPGCYGHLTVGQALDNVERANQAYPHRPLEAGKAFKEMLHRYLAASLGLLILVIAAFAWANRHDPAQPSRLPLLLVMLVVFQGLLGMWTVTLLLKPLFVVAHLIGGLTTMALLWWLALPASAAGADSGLRRTVLLALAILALQIALGGWVSSNYAALACPDFPTCQASLWPEMDFRDAFVLWRGLGIDYEGGVLDHPARVAIHYTHRIGALLAALVLGLAVWQARSAGSRRERIAAAALGVVLVIQLVLGPAMVLARLPLPLATAHNAVAALLLLAAVALLRSVPAPATGGRTALESRASS